MVRRINSSQQTRAVLLVLFERPQSWRYGYDLIKETGLRSGTLYPLLMRLHDQALLDAEWHPSAQAGRPPRHAYRLTQNGIALAEEVLSSTTSTLAGAAGALA
ncbi:PadR family transcriptional regulator [Sphingorhabdus sp.]|jgi:PadR family transcriptional regulator PadR|uniref:PadR family transcriptional regulator n=1 Tax=Sphingorhabdus sp. TaxID=1902408 RepID=UPI0037C5D6D8